MRQFWGVNLRFSLEPQFPILFWLVISVAIFIWKIYPKSIFSIYQYSWKYQYCIDILTSLSLYLVCRFFLHIFKYWSSINGCMLKDFKCHSPSPPTIETQNILISKKKERKAFEYHSSGLSVIISCFSRNCTKLPSSLARFLSKLRRGYSKVDIYL